MSQLKLKTSYKDIVRFAIPISVAMVIPQINFVINNVFLSNLNEHALGTAGITGVYYLIFSVIGSGFNSGLQSLLSRFAGQNKKKDIGQYIAQALKLAILLSLVGILFTYVLAPTILKSQLKHEEVYQMAIEFIRIRILGLPFLYMYQLGNSFLISTNNTRYLVIGAIAEAGINILLDYLLIFGHGGFSAMGFKGAAWASILAEGVGMFFVLAVLSWKRLFTEFKVRINGYWDGTATYVMIERSAPLVFQLLVSIISWLLFYLWIEHLGERSLAISNTMRNVFGMFGIFIWALAATSNNMVSNVIGQHELEEVIPTIKKIATLSFVIVLPLCLALNIFPHLFYALFNAKPDFIQEAIPVMRVVSIAVLLMSVGAVWLNAISGTGMTKINLLIEVITVVFYIVYVYVAVRIPTHTLMWAWASEFVYWGIIITGCLFFFYRFPWEERVRIQMESSKGSGTL